MQLNHFSVRVIGGDEASGGYVPLNHNQQYSLRMRNDNDALCDAHVEIDGKTVGIWRIKAHDSITLERPVNDQGRFTFYLLDTPEAAQAQLYKGDPNVGLVKVTFTPGRLQVRPVVAVAPQPYHYWKHYWHPPVVIGTIDCPPNTTWACSNTATVSCNVNPVSNNYHAVISEAPLMAGAIGSAGGTGLSGHSDQYYGYANALEYDYSQQTTIFLRLVGKADVVRPLTSYSTPVPPAVE